MGMGIIERLILPIGAERRCLVGTLRLLQQHNLRVRALELHPRAFYVHPTDDLLRILEPEPVALGSASAGAGAGAARGDSSALAALQQIIADEPAASRAHWRDTLAFVARACPNLRDLSLPMATGPSKAYEFHDRPAFHTLSPPLSSICYLIVIRLRHLFTML